MADPTPTELTGGLGTLATTTVNFTAQAAGVALILTVAADNYRTTSGSGRPESTGWTYLNGQEGNLGHYVWYKISTGSENSVQFTLTGAAKSAYSLAALDEMDASPLGATNTATSGTPSTLTAQPQSVAAVTPTAGSRWCVVACVGTTGNVNGGPYTWAGGYTKLSERYNTSGYRPGTSIGTRTQDGGTSVTGTVASTTNTEQVFSVVAAWKVAAAGANFSPPFRRNPSRGLIMRGKR